MVRKRKSSSASSPQGAGEPGQGQDRVKRLILTLRSITLAVQVVPFVFSLFYIVSFALYSVLPESAQTVCDTLFFISPLVVIAHLVYSRILHLCKWHKTACLIPIFPQAVSFVDYYVIELTEIEALVTNLLTVSMIVLLLVAAYNVFLK